MALPRVLPSLSRLSLALLAAALGCTAAQRTARAPTVQKLADGSQIVCQMERPTGSHISEEVCRRVVPGDLARAQLQNEFAKPKNPPVVP